MALVPEAIVEKLEPMAMAPRPCAVTLTLFVVGLCAVPLHVNFGERATSETGVNIMRS